MYNDVLHVRCYFQVCTAPYGRVFPAEEYDNKDVEDNCELDKYLNSCLDLSLIFSLRYYCIQYMWQVLNCLNVFIF